MNDRSRPAAAGRAAEMRQFLLFCISGAIGFLVDAGIVQWLVAGMGQDPYLSRLVSVLCAMTATWAFNRRYTFQPRRDEPLWREWLRYCVAMLGGFAVNYSVYAGMVYAFPLVRSWPLLGVAAGSIAGLVVNYASSRWWVFRKSNP
jgi:putative flippase GtrA